MKMYACKRMGRSNTIGTSWHFSGIPGFDSERCAIKCNKAEKQFLLDTIKFDVEKLTEEFGSAWINGQQITELKNKLDKLDNLDDREIKMRETMTRFMEVCLRQGYDIRFY